MVDDEKTKILIIDDDSFLLDMYSLKFSESGFDVNTANGSEAVLKLLSEGYVADIILLDIVMPTMDGFELLEEINKRNLAAGAVKIILSNLGQQADIEKGKKLGALGYIVKASATPTEVVLKVKEIIEDSVKK